MKQTKNILNAPFLTEMTQTAANLYRLGWDERNGGNISLLLDDAQLAEYLDPEKVRRVLPLDFDASALAGRSFLVTGTGKYFKNVASDPETNLGIVRIAPDGRSAALLWGLRDGGRFTSEFPAHLMSHAARLRVDPENRVILHSHPTHLVALTFVLPLDDRSFSHELWQMGTECMVVFPEGVGVLPWMLCGNAEIGRATAEKMREFRLVVWGLHGIYGAGRDLDEAFGLIETAEKAAQLYLLTAHLPRRNTISDGQLREIAAAFGLSCRAEFLVD